MDKDSMMLAIVAIVAIVGIVIMVNNGKLDLAGRAVDPDIIGCQVQPYYGECWELGENWKEDSENPGWCRNCNYISYYE